MYSYKYFSLTAYCTMYHCGKLTPLGNLHNVVMAQTDCNIIKSRYQFTNKRLVDGEIWCGPIHFSIKNSVKASHL